MSNRTNPYYEIRAFATRYKIATAIIAGVVATHIATMTGYWNHGVGLPVLDWNTTNGLQLLPKASHNTQFFAGFDPVAIAAATPSIRPDPRVGLANGYQTRRALTLQAKVTF